MKNNSPTHLQTITMKQKTRTQALLRWDLSEKASNQLET